MNHNSFSISSQKVRNQIFIWSSFLHLISWSIKHLKGFFEVLGNAQNRCHISASVTIIRSWPHGYEILLGEPVFEAVHHQLMSPCNQLKVVYVIEFCRYSTSKKPSCTSWGHRPAFDIFWVGPHHVTKRPFMRDFDPPVDHPRLINRLDLRREPAMNA